ncbi:hypothetical protein EC991_003300 [Linnemannia zychae]|nr:hypothetical protein EC991_003300 [Linnemannia zychae]
MPFCLPPSTILPKVLSLGIGPIDTIASNGSEEASTVNLIAPPLDYLAEIRHLHQHPWAPGRDQLWKWTHPPPGISDYLRSSEFSELCQQRALFPMLDHPLLVDHKPDQELMQRCYQMLFFQEASWVLANPVLEQLSSMTTPFSTIGRYLDPSSISRLGRLEKVHIIFDVFRENLQDKDTFAPMVKFVQDHTRLFPGILKSVTSSTTLLWSSTTYAYPMNYPLSVQMEINRMLPALRSPTSVTTMSSILQLLAHPATTDLSRVKELGDRNSISKESWDLFKENQQTILQRCRSLRKLIIEPLGEDCFKWALEEKRLAEQTRQDGLSGSVNRVVKDMGWALHEPEPWRAGLIPLEDLRILSFEGVVMHEVDNVAIAFSHTLQSIDAYYYGSIKGEYEVLTRFDKGRTLRIGTGWDILPAMTDLMIQIGVRGLAVDPLLYLQLPNVVSIDLDDNVREYRCEDLDSPCLPARLSQLKSLTLNGLPALTFHSATLHSTTQLRSMSFTSDKLNDRIEDFTHASEDNDEFSHPFCFIPPVDELKRSHGIQDSSTSNPTPPVFIRPKWTWDWHLPNLVSLTLASEFAYLFEFRMLHGCPALHSLELEMRTDTKLHSRTITSADMFTSSGDAIVLPVLTKLRLHGCWEFADPTIAIQFLTGMFPSLKTLSALDWSGLSAKNTIHIARSLSLEELCLSFWFTKKEQETFGLIVAEDHLKYREEDVLMRRGCIAPVSQ